MVLKLTDYPLKDKNMNLPAVISAARINICIQLLVLGNTFYKHYNVISIATENVAEHITLQKIAEMATLKDNTLQKCNLEVLH